VFKGLSMLRRTILLLGIILLSLVEGYGQNQDKIDSLKTELQTDLHDTTGLLQTIKYPVEEF